MKANDVYGYKEVEVFENQRLRPLFGWGSAGYLFPMDPACFSDESGTVNSDTDRLQDILPPTGYEWANEWTLSKSHNVPDKEGWSYGSSFASLAARSKTDTRVKGWAIHHVVRRRLWRRLARPIRGSVVNTAPTLAVQVGVYGTRHDLLTGCTGNKCSAGAQTGATEWLLRCSLGI